MQNLVAWQGFLLPLCLLLFLDGPIALDCDDLLIFGRHWVSSGIALWWREIDSAHDSNIVSRAWGINSEEMKDVKLTTTAREAEAYTRTELLAFCFRDLPLHSLVWQCRMAWPQDGDEMGAWNGSGRG